MMKWMMFVAALLACQMTVAQSQPDSSRWLQDVEISGERIQTPFSQASRSMSVLSKREIEQLPAQQLAEILSYIPGIDIRQRGPQGVQADVGIRGGSFDQTLVLINGIRLSDPQTGHHLLNLVVQPDQIERIEVLKGPGTRIYGPNAFAGAINIITRPGKERAVTAALSGGEFGLYHTNLSVQLPVKGWHQTLSAGLQGSNGYRYNTDFRLGNVFYDGGTVRGKHQFRAMAGYNQRAFGANGFYANENFKDQYEETSAIFGAFTHQFQAKNGKSEVRAYYRQHTDDYFFIRSNPGFFHNHHVSRVGGLEWNGSRKHAYLQQRGWEAATGWGAELRSENLVSSNLGERQRQWAGLYTEHRLQHKRWMLNPGLYLNGISGYGWRIYPGLEAAWFPAKGLNIYGNVAQSFRVPTYTDLYYRSPSNIGNPNLAPEQAWTYELGSRFIHRQWLIQGALFVRDANRLIEWVRPDAFSPWQANNFIEVVSRGAEIEGQWRPQLSWLRQLRLGYTYIDAGFAVMPGFQSRYVLENLRHQLVLQGVFSLPWGIEASLGVRMMQRINQLQSDWVSDLQLQRRWGKGFETFVQATNLTNNSYREIGTVPMPGRWVRGGLRLRLDVLKADA
ncbi:MAG: TonB-dependent receptor [Sphingobacteriaceae bacterium]|nr:TonB-dependent receptor [Sphingobacteriaceae bacterium]